MRLAQRVHEVKAEVTELEQGHLSDTAKMCHIQVVDWFSKFMGSISHLVETGHTDEARRELRTMRALLDRKVDELITEYREETA